MHNLKHDTSELTCKTETDLENKLMVTRREGKGKGIVREFDINMYTLLHLVI